MAEIIHLIFDQRLLIIRRNTKKYL